MNSRRGEWCERMRERWNSHRFTGKGGFQGKALVVLDGRELLVEMRGWKMMCLSPSVGEGVDVILSGSPARLKKVRGEEELAWMVINRELRVKGKFRLFSRSLTLWAKLLPFLVSSLRR